MLNPPTETAGDPKKKPESNDPNDMGFCSEDNQEEIKLDQPVKPPKKKKNKGKAQAQTELYQIEDKV